MTLIRLNHYLYRSHNNNLSISSFILTALKSDFMPLEVKFLID